MSAGLSVWLSVCVCQKTHSKFQQIFCTCFSSQTAFADYCLDRFFWATRFLFLFFLIFFVYVPCARLIWPPRQLLNARKSTALCHIVVFLSPEAVTRSSFDGNTIFYVLPVLWMSSFSYNADKRPESKTTHMFRLVRQVAAWGRSLPSLIASSLVSKCVLHQWHVTVLYDPLLARICYVFGRSPKDCT